jgi:hypothetical protein
MIKENVAARRNRTSLPITARAFAPDGPWDAANERPEAVLPALIPFNLFLLEDPHDDGAEKRKDEADGQKLQLPYHGDTPSSQDR